MLKPLPENGFCPVCGEFEDECECPQYPATMDKYKVVTVGSSQLSNLSKINGGIRMAKMNWDITTWSESELKSWLHAIGERSDRVISRCEESGDSTEQEHDEALYQKLSAELERRSIKYAGEFK